MIHQDMIAACRLAGDTEHDYIGQIEMTTQDTDRGMQTRYACMKLEE